MVIKPYAFHDYDDPESFSGFHFRPAIMVCGEVVWIGTSKHVGQFAQDAAKEEAEERIRAKLEALFN